nr:hypothetical protein [Tanacetum cinerariifolium]
MAKIQEVPTADTGTDFEPVEKVQNVAGYNVFANNLQHFEQYESISNTCLVETDDSNVIPDSPDMCNDDIQNDQNDVESDDERDGTSWSNVVEEGGGVSNSSNSGWNKISQLVLEDGTNGIEEGGFGMSPELIVAGVISRSAGPDLLCSEALAVSSSKLTTMDRFWVTKKPNVVPINNRKPKSQANKSVATHHKKKVASKSTNQKPHSYFRVLYENTCTDFEPVEKVQNVAGYNVFANDLQHFEQYESISNTCLVETDDSNVIPDSPDMCNDDIQNDQNDVESDDERVALANLKLDVDENKKIQNKSLGESISVRDSFLVALQNNQTDFEKYKAFNDRTIDYDKLERKLNEALGQLALKDIEIKEGLVKKKTMVITDLKLREEQDIDKMLSMEKQLKFLNEIIYKRSQSIQTIHMMAPKVPTYNGRPTFANPRYLKQAQSEIPCLYAFPYDQSTNANRLIPDGKETLALERESRSKLNKDLVRPYDYSTLNSLYENFKPPTQEFEIQLAHANEIRKKIWRKSFVKYKPNIYKNVGFLPILKSISKSRQAYNVMTNNINHFKEIVDNAWIKHSKDQFHVPTAQDMKILIQTCLMPLAIKTQNDSFLFVHELKQEMHADLKYVESLEKEIDELEYDKAEFLNMYDMILQECMSKDVMCSYLLSLSDLDALDELQCLYLHKVKECDCLAQMLSNKTKYVSKEVHSELLKHFAKVEKHSISLKIALQKRKEQVNHDTVWNEKASNVFRKEREQYIKIQDLKAQLQDKNIAISELKKPIEKGKGKYVETKFDKPFVVRQLNAQRIPKPLVLGKSAPFSNSLERIYFSKTKSVHKTNVSEGLSKPVTAQTLPQTTRQAVSNINVLKPGMYQIDNMSKQTRAPQLPKTVRNTNPRVSTSTGVNHKTNVSIPQHKRNQLKDKVVPNNSQVKPKKTQVEVHPRIPSVSNKMKSVTVFDSNHFACVTKMLNDVNARTKKPNVVPISTRKPKSHANKSVSTSHKKKVASKSTNQKPQSYFRMLYEKTSKAWKCFVENGMGTVRFGNDQFAPILGYGDLV